MLTQNARRVIIVDKADKIVGIVSRSDVLGQVIK